MVEQATGPDDRVTEIRTALVEHRRRVQQLFDQANANAPPRARTRLGHWLRSFVSRHYQESHFLLDSRSRELAEIEFRLRAVKLYAGLQDRAASLRSRLIETRFSEDLEERLSRGAASLGDDFAKAIAPEDPYRELTEEQRARVADRLDEFKGLIAMTMEELQQRIHETDVAKWFAGDAQPAATAAAEEATPIEKVQNELEETKDKLQQAHDELDSLKGWTTFLGTLWLIDLLNND